MAEKGRSNYFILLTGQFTGRRGNTHIIVETQFRRRNIIGGITYLLPSALSITSASWQVFREIPLWNVFTFTLPFIDYYTRIPEIIIHAKKNNPYRARMYSSHVQIRQGDDDDGGTPTTKLMTAVDLHCHPTLHLK